MRQSLREAMAKRNLRESNRKGTPYEITIPFEETGKVVILKGTPYTVVDQERTDDGFCFSIEVKAEGLKVEVPFTFDSVMEARESGWDI